MATYTLKELITEYRIPLDVKKPKWYGDYFFRAQTVNRNGTVTGTKRSLQEAESMSVLRW